MEEGSPHKEVHANLVGGLNEHGSHRLICLNVWSLVSSTVLEKIRGCGLVGVSPPVTHLCLAQSVSVLCVHPHGLNHKEERHF